MRSHPHRRRPEFRGLHIRQNADATWAVFPRSPISGLYAVSCTSLEKQATTLNPKGCRVSVTRGALRAVNAVNTCGSNANTPRRAAPRRGTPERRAPWHACATELLIVASDLQQSEATSNNSVGASSPLAVRLVTGNSELLLLSQNSVTQLFASRTPHEKHRLTYSSREASRADSGSGAAFGWADGKTWTQSPWFGTLMTLPTTPTL